MRCTRTQGMAQTATCRPPACHTAPSAPRHTEVACTASRRQWPRGTCECERLWIGRG